MIGATAVLSGAPDLGLLTQTEMTGHAASMVRAVEIPVIAARAVDPLLIIGRTDAMAATGVDDALERAQRYRAVGADVIFVDAVKRLADVGRIAREIPPPVILSVVEGNETAMLTVCEIESMGLAAALYPLSALLSAAAAVAGTLAALKEGRPAPQVPESMMTCADFMDVVDLPCYQALDDQFGSHGEAAT